MPPYRTGRCRFKAAESWGTTGWRRGLVNILGFVMQIPPLHQISNHRSHFLEMEPSALVSNCRQPQLTMVLGLQGEPSRILLHEQL